MLTTEAEYRLSPKAKDDMAVVWLYSLAEGGKAQTECYVDTLITVFGLLADNPIQCVGGIKNLNILARMQHQ